MITEERYLELVDKVNQARPLYMNGQETGISDETYDSYMADIYDYEKYHIAAKNSPTRSVNPASGGDVIHPVPMLSLKDVFNVDDAVAFIQKYQSRTSFSVENKLDGLSVQLIYRGGQLISASTRGDGKVGVECLATAKFIEDIPKDFPVVADMPSSEELIVHGEVFMRKSRFDEYCAKYGKQANCRNTAVGLFKRQNEPERARYLSFQAYNIDKMGCLGSRTELECATQEQDLEFLSELGIPVVNYLLIDNGSELPDFLKDLEEIRKDMDIPIDGMVIKFNSIKERAAVGDNGVIPSWAVAYKFPAQEQETRLKAIDWKVGATGELTPVAILEPVPVMGSMIGKATLHHKQRVKDLGLQIGDMVVVYKAGDIIPAIKSTRHTEESIPVEFPTHCPACGAELRDGVVCGNIQCKEKLLARLNGWTDKKIGNFKGVSSSLVNGLFDKGKLRIPSDFYKVKGIDILTLPGSGKAKVSTYIKRVEESKKAMTFAQVLVGLGINNLSHAGAAEMEKYMRLHHPKESWKVVLNGFISLPKDTLQKVLGNAKGSSVYEQLADPFIREIIEGIGEVFCDRIL